MFPILRTEISSSWVFERVIRFFNELSCIKNQVIVCEGQVFDDSHSKIYIIVSGKLINLLSTGKFFLMKKASRVIEKF